MKKRLTYFISFLLLLLCFSIGCTAESAAPDSSESNVDYKYEYSLDVMVSNQNTGENIELTGETKDVLLSLLNGFHWNNSLFKHRSEVIITFSDGNSLEYHGMGGIINDVKNNRSVLLSEKQRTCFEYLISYHHKRIHFDSVDELAGFLFASCYYTESKYNEYVTGSKSSATTFYQEYGKLLCEHLKSHPIPVLKDNPDSDMNIDYYLNINTRDAKLCISFDIEEVQYVFEYKFKGAEPFAKKTPHGDPGSPIGPYIYQTRFTGENYKKGTFLCEDVWVELSIYAEDSSNISFDQFTFKTVRPYSTVMAWTVAAVVVAALLAGGTVAFVLIKRKKKKCEV